MSNLKVANWLVGPGKEAFEMVRRACFGCPRRGPGPPQNFSYTVKHRTMLDEGISHWYHFLSALLSFLTSQLLLHFVYLRVPSWLKIELVILGLENIQKIL
jgi:hypothetical protein